MVNLDKINRDLDVAKKEYQKELSSTGVTDRYWKKVEESRQYFEKELKVLFPGVDLQDRQVHKYTI